MIVMLSARRLKPGAWEQFRRAWDPGEAKPPGFQRASHARNIRADEEVISFGSRPDRGRLATLARRGGGPGDGASRSPLGPRGERARLGRAPGYRHAGRLTGVRYGLRCSPLSRGGKDQT
jgi:hypothetical protein